VPDHLIVFVVVNSIKPYGLEVNNLLALPSGAPYRARFRTKWIVGIDDPWQISGRDGLVVLRVWETAKFIPLRRIRTAVVEPVGDTYYINYLVEDFPDFDSDQESRDRQLDRFNAAMTVEIADYPNTPNTDMQKLIFLGPDLAGSIVDEHPKTVASSSDRWGRVVGLLDAIELYRDLDFLHVLSITEGGRGDRAAEFVKGRAKLANDRPYSLEVFQRSHTGRSGDSSVSPRELELLADPDTVTLDRVRFAVLGKYERFRFTFRTTSSRRRRFGYLTVATNRHDGSLVPPIDIPVEVTTSRARVVSMLVSFVAFVVAAIVVLVYEAGHVFPDSDAGRATVIVAFMIMTLTAQDVRALLGAILDRITIGLSRG
jgi:hypothetical protein